MISDYKPANLPFWPSVDLTLVHRLQRCPNNKTLCQRPVFVISDFEKKKEKKKIIKKNNNNNNDKINNNNNNNNNNDNNNNNKVFIYRRYRYIQQRTKSMKIKNIHTCMYQPTEHSSSAVGPSYMNIKKTYIDISIYLTCLNNIIIST